MDSNSERVRKTVKVWGRRDMVAEGSGTKSRKKRVFTPRKKAESRYKQREDKGSKTEKTYLITGRSTKPKCPNLFVEAAVTEINQERARKKWSKEWPNYEIVKVVRLYVLYKSKRDTTL